MNELNELNELGFESINEVINSDGFKKYITKIYEKTSDSSLC